MTPTGTQHHPDAGWQFDNSYARLPDAFHARLNPVPVRAPKLVVFNAALAKSLGLNPELLQGEAGADAEACFREAVDVARRQEAKSLELRASVSLGRLLQKQGKQGEARRLLAEVYDWFTEGFATPDLQEAKALLDEL